MSKKRKKKKEKSLAYEADWNREGRNPQEGSPIEPPPPDLGKTIVSSLREMEKGEFSCVNEKPKEEGIAPSPPQKGSPSLHAPSFHIQSKWDDPFFRTSHKNGNVPNSSCGSSDDQRRAKWTSYDTPMVVLFILGVVFIGGGFYCLSQGAPMGADKLSSVSPFLILTGYIAMGLGFFIKK